MKKYLAIKIQIIKCMQNKHTHKKSKVDSKTDFFKYTINSKGIIGK